MDKAHGQDDHRRDGLADVVRPRGGAAARMSEGLPDDVLRHADRCSGWIDEPAALRGERRERVSQVSNHDRMAGGLSSRGERPREGLLGRPAFVLPFPADCRGAGSEALLQSSKRGQRGSVDRQPMCLPALVQHIHNGGDLARVDYLNDTLPLCDAPDLGHMQAGTDARSEDVAHDLRRERRVVLLEDLRRVHFGRFGGGAGPLRLGHTERRGGVLIRIEPPCPPEPSGERPESDDPMLLAGGQPFDVRPDLGELHVAQIAIEEHLRGGPLREVALHDQDMMRGGRLPVAVAALERGDELPHEIRVQDDRALFVVANEPLAGEHGVLLDTGRGPVVHRVGLEELQLSERRRLGDGTETMEVAPVGSAGADALFDPVDGLAVGIDRRATALPDTVPVRSGHVAVLACSAVRAGGCRCVRVACRHQISAQAGERMTYNSRMFRADAVYPPKPKVVSSNLAGPASLSLRSPRKNRPNHRESGRGGLSSTGVQNRPEPSAGCVSVACLPVTARRSSTRGFSIPATLWPSPRKSRRIRHAGRSAGSPVDQRRAGGPPALTRSRGGAR